VIELLENLGGILGSMFSVEIDGSMPEPFTVGEIERFSFKENPVINGIVRLSDTHYHKNQKSESSSSKGQINRNWRIDGSYQ
jgi:hypothetical protein